MAILGDTSEPTSTAEAWSNSNNHFGQVLTLPSGGPWKITRGAFWAAGYGASPSARAMIWSADSGATIGFSDDTTLVERSFAVGNSDLYDLVLVSLPIVAGGTVIFAGFAISPLTSGAFFGLRASGSHREKDNTSYPGDMSGATTHSAGDMGAYITYELANSLPNAPTLTGPGDNTIVGDTTPTLTLTHSDPDSDPCASYDIQVDSTSGYGVAPDWVSPAWEVVNGTSGISGNNVTRDVGSALSRGTWYGWRARTSDAVGDGAWSSIRYFKVNQLPTISSRDPG